MIPNKLRSIINSLKTEEWINVLHKYADVYVVGGSVRDAFIDKPLKDIDLIIDGLSFSGIQKHLEQFGKLDLVGDSFSVIKFKPTGYVGEPYDIAIPRMDRKTGDGHKDFEIITDGVDILEDLKRRDFTINSMAIDVFSGTLIDPFNGKADLDLGLIRATDVTAFMEDPLRILRGIQFACRFGFEIEANTFKLMKQHVDLIGHIVGERILEEFQKIIFKNGNTQMAFDLIHATDLDYALFGKKMTYYHKGFDKLDEVSFFYILGVIGDQDPYDFYMKRLKGKKPIGKLIKFVDKIHTSWSHLDDIDKKYLIFTMMTKTNGVIGDVELLPPDSYDILEEMKNGIIPTTPDQLHFNGDDIAEVFDVSGQDIGAVKERLTKDALENAYNWKSQEETFKYMDYLINE